MKFSVAEREHHYEFPVLLCHLRREITFLRRISLVLPLRYEYGLFIASSLRI